MATWLTTMRGNLVNLDQCVSVFVERDAHQELPWALKAEVVAGPANPLFAIARFADETAARDALEDVRGQVTGRSARPLDFRADQFRTD